MREVHEIRWMSFYNSLNAICRSWKALCKYFQSHKADSSRTKGLFENITDYKFVCCMYLMMDIIPSLAALSMTMQKQDLDISSVRPAIDGIFSAVDQALSSKSYYQQLLHTSHMKKDVKMKQVTVQGVKVTVSNEENIREAQKSFGSTRTSFLKSPKDQLDRRFPKKELKVATSFQALGLRPLSFLSRENY
ncbi:uncharacterized protein LOC124286825 [Haliotis rubra]|uniref:uncharacterized protein LOC124286825 n=1 Tax=Haliotis rubra TaxID=36100 RepID=UPI001EE51EB2|nr:uncharacterized protein LOC124286825 [Haliotis rubra]